MTLFFRMAVATFLLGNSAMFGQAILIQVEPDETGTITAEVTAEALVDDTSGQLHAFNRKWIGVVCTPVEDLLRAHIKLPEGVGIVVQQVIPESPAGKAGLQEHDILLRVGDRPATSIDTLIDAIGSLEEGGKLKIEWHRRDKQISAELIPVSRPDSIRLKWQVESKDDVEDDLSRIKSWLGKLEGGQWQGVPSKLRVFGPGMIISPKMPTNLSIRIEKNGNQPSKIKITRNDDRWEITEDHLDELPDDIRPHVASMLGGNGITVGIAPDGVEPNGTPWPRIEERFDEMNQRMEKMFQELQRLQELNRQPMPKPKAKTEEYDPKNDASLPRLAFQRVA